LAKITPKIIPTEAIHNGTYGGMDKVKSAQVTRTASLTFLFFFPVNIYSAAIPEIKTTAPTSRSLQPYSINAKKNTGARAYSTLRIISCF